MKMVNGILLSVTRSACQKFDRQTARTRKMLLIAFCLMTGAIALNSIVNPSDELLLSVGSISKATLAHMNRKINNDTLIPLGKMKGEIDGQYDSFYVAVDLKAQLFINRNISYNSFAYRRENGWEPITRKELEEFEKHLHFRPFNGNRHAHIIK